MTLEIAQAIREARGGLDWMGVEVKAPPAGSGSSKNVASRGQISVPIARITSPESDILQNIKQFSKEVLDVCNGVGTQSETANKGGGGGGKKKSAEIEKMYLSTSLGLSVQVTDVQSVLS